MMDFTIRYEGSVILLTPNTQAGRDWIGRHLPQDSLTWGSVALVVEHREISNAIDRIQESGLEVECG